MFSEESKRAWAEYDAAAEWCARRGIKGRPEDPLPPMLSVDAQALIDEDPEAFERRVADTAYGLHMEEVERRTGGHVVVKDQTGLDAN